MDIKRRDFFMIAGAASMGALLSATGCKKFHAELQRSSDWFNNYKREKPPVPGQEDWRRGEIIAVKTICRQCPVGCGIKVKIQEGRVIQITGNPDSPVNSGGIGPKAASSPQVLYDPHRLQHPLKRNKQGQLEKISWKDALSEVAGKLAALRKGGAHKLVSLSGINETIGADLFERFTRAYGSPNYINPASEKDEAIEIAMKLMLGVGKTPVVDWENVDTVYSFGTALYDSYCQSAHLSGGLKNLRYSKNKSYRARVVHFDAQFGRTAAKTERYPVKHGTYGILAMGMARVIVEEKLYNSEFIKKNTTGFEQFVELLKDKRYSLPEVSLVCGIDNREIHQLARDFALSSQSVAIADSRATNMTNGLYTAMAIYALNALVGSFGIKGGLSFPKDPPLKAWPKIKEDDSLKKGLAQPRIDLAGTEDFPFASSVPEALLEALETGKPYKPEAILLYYCNPVYSRPDANRFKKAFEQIPLKISFSPVLDDTAILCDYILPDDSFLERWDLHKGSQYVNFSNVGLQRPVMVDIKGWRDEDDRIKFYKLYDTKDTGTFLIELARAVGGTLAQSFQGKDEEDSYYVFDNAREVKDKTILTPSIEAAIWSRVRGLVDHKKSSIKAEDFSAFQTALKKQGIWFDKSERGWEVGLKFSFFSSAMKEKIDGLASKKEDKKAELERLLKKWKVTVRGDEVYMPHYEAPLFFLEKKNPSRAGTWPGEEYPFYLYAYKPMTYSYGSGANLPWLQELQSTRTGKTWGSYLEINSHVAHKLGLGRGDKVRVISSVSSSEPIEVVFYEGLPHEMVAIARGMGHKTHNEYETFGININELLVNQFDYLSGVSAVFATKVKIVKA